MTQNPSQQLTQLRQWFASVESALVAYSGGVDSAVLMAVAHQQLGAKALACIGVSPSYPQREREQAVALAQQVGAAFRLVDTQEHLDASYAANPANRCYFCKSELFNRLTAVARQEGWQTLLDGNNADDLHDDRPGRIAGRELQVRSPLAELGIGKDAVRSLALELGLPVWDKPASPCLSSRVPHGTAITPELLARIERAEEALFSAGFRQFRVRHHGDIARIELPIEDLPRALELRQSLLGAIQQAGYRHVCLDLAGFRSGALHQETAGQMVSLQVKAAAPGTSA